MISIKTKTHSQKIKEAIIDLKEGSAKEIIDRIEARYPEEPVNKASYQADIIGSSVNHSSTHHYPHMEKFLWFDATSRKYRMAQPLETTEAIKPYENEEVDGIPVARLSANGLVRIPTQIREQLDFNIGDRLAFIVNEKGVLEVRKARFRLELS